MHSIIKNRIPAANTSPSFENVSAPCNYYARERCVLSSTELLFLGKTANEVVAGTAAIPALFS